MTRDEWRRSIYTDLEFIRHEALSIMRSPETLELDERLEQCRIVANTLRMTDHLMAQASSMLTVVAALPIQEALFSGMQVAS